MKNKRTFPYLIIVTRCDDYSGKLNWFLLKEDEDSDKPTEFESLKEAKEWVDENMRNSLNTAFVFTIISTRKLNFR